MANREFTIGTLVTRPDQYAQMQASMRNAGFGDDCEYISIDNTSGPQTDAYAGLNRILNLATGRYVILCHQDILFLEQDREDLERMLAELADFDPHWALAGNSGYRRFLDSHTRITDKFGNRTQGGPFPAKVNSLDENFIVVRSEARIALSRDLTGFHLYGTDICLIADMLGWSSYVIDFHVKHLGEGKTGKSFGDARTLFMEKWRYALRHRELQTPATYMLLTGDNCPAWYAYLKEKVLRRIARMQRRRRPPVILPPTPNPD